MSLLSRIRKTVKSQKPIHDTVSKRCLSSSRKDAIGSPDSSNHYNFQKSTQSSIEKSLKPHSTFRSYSDDQQRYKTTHQTEPPRKNSKNDAQMPGRSRKSSTTGNNTTLSRSDTFTMNDVEVELSDQHVSQQIKKEESHDNSHAKQEKYSRYGTNGGNHKVAF